MQSGFIPFIRKGKMEPVFDGVLVTRQSPKEQAWLVVCFFFFFFWRGVCFFFPGGERVRRNFGLLKTKRKGKKLISPYDFNTVWLAALWRQCLIFLFAFPPLWMWGWDLLFLIKCVLSCVALGNCTPCTSIPRALCCPMWKLWLYRDLLFPLRITCAMA